MIQLTSGYDKAKNFYLLVLYPGSINKLSLKVNFS